MKVCILQPSYIPWRGYFHQILKADVFVFYDDVQYDKHGWRNRNRIKTPNGSCWITIPVHTKGVVDQGVTINEVKIDWTKKWNDKHWRAISMSYGKAPFFGQYESLLQSLYARHDEYLADFTISTTEALARALGIEHTKFMRSSMMRGIAGSKTERLISILTQIGCTHYISGPSAQDYIDHGEFAKAGISVEFMTYDYPEYPQLHPPYDANVSIIDLLLMMGPDATKSIAAEQGMANVSGRTISHD
jgi:hypothetical protein